MIDSAARAFKKSPGARFILVGNRNREESDLLPTARANNVRKLLEGAGVPPSAISVQVGSGTTRTVEIVLIQSN
jgi:outer membrane protein OmpA-like peptidoglycan-associated protein